MTKPVRLAPRRGQPAAGFTLIELMVAVTIGLVIVLGFAVTFVNMKVTFNTQDKMAQLQDNERLAMSLLTSSLQEAGYYNNCADPTSVPIKPPQPSCTKDRRIVSLPAFAITGSPGGGMTTASGVGVYATAWTSASSPETLTTVYSSVPGDGVMSCQGTTVASAVTSHPIAFRNTFYVDAASKALGCMVAAYDVLVPTSPTMIASYPLAFAPLVSNVTSMSVKYAVDTSSSGGPTQYQAPSAVTAATNWGNVKGAQISLSFVNPNASLGTSAPVVWIQNVNLMNNK